MMSKKDKNATKKALVGLRFAQAVLREVQNDPELQDEFGKTRFASLDTAVNKILKVIDTIDGVDNYPDIVTTDDFRYILDFAKTSVHQFWSNFPDTDHTKYIPDIPTVPVYPASDPK